MPSASERPEDLRDVRHEARLCDGYLHVPLAKESDAFGRALPSDGRLQEHLEPVPDHLPHARDRQGLFAEALHRKAEGVRDGVVSVDERPVEVEDHERGRQAAHGLRARSSPASRSTVRTIPWTSAKAWVGSASSAGRSETRASTPSMGGRAARARVTSIFGTGRDLYPSIRTRSQSENSRARRSSTGPSGPRRRAVVRPGVTKAEIAAPEVAWRWESL